MPDGTFVGEVSYLPHYLRVTLAGDEILIEEIELPPFEQFMGKRPRNMLLELANYWDILHCVLQYVEVE